MELVLSVYHFWVSFKPILEYRPRLIHSFSMAYKLRYITTLVGFDFNFFPYILQKGDPMYSIQRWFPTKVFVQLATFSLCDRPPFLTLVQKSSMFRNGKPSCWSGQEIALHWRSYESSGSLVAPVAPSSCRSQSEDGQAEDDSHNDVFEEVGLKNLCGDAVAEKLLGPSVEAASPTAHMSLILSWRSDLKTS